MRNNPFINKCIKDGSYTLADEKTLRDFGMISGPDFSEPDAIKGSKTADEYDNNVLSGNFKPVEIQ